jgi:transposase InsO family protein
MRQLLRLATIALRCIPAFFRSRSKQAIVELALRQQLATFSEKGHRSRITPTDRGFWVLLSRTWSGWKEVLVIVQPDTVARWHRKGFRLYWRAMDFLLVPTAGFRLLYAWFVIGHGRREILHFGVTEHPTASWVIQQLREAFPDESAPRFLIFDNDSIFSGRVADSIQNLGTEPRRTSFRSPWQSGIAERWVGSVRRELLDHVIVLK